MQTRRRITGTRKLPTTAVKKTARTPAAILKEHFGSTSARDTQAFERGYQQCTAAEKKAAG